MADPSPQGTPYKVDLTGEAESALLVASAHCGINRRGTINRALQVYAQIFALEPGEAITVNGENAPDVVIQRIR